MTAQGLYESDTPQAGITGQPRPGRGRHERRDECPFPVGQVTSITQMIMTMLATGGRRPHPHLQTGFDNRLESHLNPTIHPKTQFQDGLLGN